MDGTETEGTSVIGSLQAHIQSTSGDLRHSDGSDLQRVVRPTSRLCLSLKDHDKVTVGNTKIEVYRHHGRIRLVIITDRDTKITKEKREKI